MKSRMIAALFAVPLCTLAAAGQSAPNPAAAKVDVSSIAPPAHPATEAQIREYLALNHAIDTAHQLIKDDLRTSRATSAPYFTPGFWDDMETALMQIDLVPYFVPAYQKYGNNIFDAGKGLQYLCNQELAVDEKEHVGWAGGLGG